MTQFYEPHQPYPVGRRNPRHAWIFAVVTFVVVVAGVILTVVLLNDDDPTKAASPAPLARTSPLSDARNACSGGRLADDDHTLVLDMVGKEPDSGHLTTDTVSCVLGELRTPQSILARMDSTRALDGMQSASWSDFEATWTYHPDDGLDVIITHTF